MVRMGRKRLLGSVFIGSVVLASFGCGAGDTGRGRRGGTAAAQRERRRRRASSNRRRRGRAIERRRERLRQSDGTAADAAGGRRARLEQVPASPPSSSWSMARAACASRSAPRRAGRSCARRCSISTSGVIYQLGGRASFGMLIYDGTVDLGLAAGAPMGPMGTGCAGPAALRCATWARARSCKRSRRRGTTR